MSPFPYQSEYSAAQSASVAAHGSLLPGAVELPRLAAIRELGMLQKQLRAAEAAVRALERGPKTVAMRRRLIERSRAADKLALDIYKLRIQLDPRLAFQLKLPLYHNWGHGGMRWLFGSLRGRVGRDVYWVALPLGLIGALLVAGAAQPLGNAWRSGDFAPLALLGCLAGGMLLWAYVAATVKRYHDMDRSGLWVWPTAVSVIGLLWQVAECGFWPGTRGPNRFE